ncbi:DUF3168 domain-containing protein [Cytobacillus horneckiae]|uniref:DUF3168 domain-containing protein n=1 Tax=Cytobacillus horneckiae TaxID=549687 RepID=UPI0020422934|nr:DUF3168 domain-containing protein [Cytobacillus horneckiae]MCM3180241.1 DUF3168 domain-containing protein [Cytobacillus horneckiae]
MDDLKFIYEAIIADPFIKDQASGRIKYYEYSATGDVTGPFIIIDGIDVPKPSDFADNQWLSYDCLVQIEVWSKNRLITEQIANKIRDVLWQKGFKQQSGPREYADGIFRDARRYRGKVYRDEII